MWREGEWIDGVFRIIISKDGQREQVVTHSQKIDIYSRVGNRINIATKQREPGMKQ